MKSVKNIIYILIGLVITSGCISTKSIASLNDKKYFKQSPSIVAYQDRYFLRFVYSDESFAFFMVCDSKIRNDSLIYYLPATTSSGNLSGKKQFQEIVITDEIEIIKKKNVYWEQPDESLVKMLIEQLKEEEIKSLPKTKKKSS